MVCLPETAQDPWQAAPHRFAIGGQTPSGNKVTLDVLKQARQNAQKEREDTDGASLS